MKEASHLDFQLSARDRVALCMIVKNEERCLERCLRSAAPWVSEMVVVDTGSTDGTVAIAESFGAKVVHFPWCDDFSAARNVSLEATTRPWALVLDADEELDVVDAVQLAEALLQDELGGFNLRLHNQLDDGTFSQAMVFRLFRRDLPSMRYQGAIHEQLQAVGEGRIATGLLEGVILRHDGYTATVMASKEKNARNVELSRKLIETQPEEPFAWYSWGIALQTSDVGEALRAFEKALALWKATGNRSAEIYVLHLYQSLVKGYFSAGQRERALAIVEEGLALYPTAADLLYGRGQLRFGAGDYLGAAADFRACLTNEAKGSAVIDTPGAAGYAALAYLGLALLNLGRHEEGEAVLRQAAAEAPAGFIVPHAALGAIVLQRGEWDAALPFLQTYQAGATDDPDARFKLGWCLYQLERYSEAEAMVAPIADTPQAQQLLGKVLLDQGQGERALAHLADCPLPSAGLAKGWAYYVTGKHESAAEVWADWMRAGAADWGTKDTLSRFLFLLQGGRPPKGLPERPAEPLRDMDLWFRLLLRHRCFENIETLIQRGPELGERLWPPLRKKWGITLIREGFRDVGTMLLLQAQQNEPADAEIYYWLGVSSLEQRLVDDAKTLWQTCLRLSPEHALARQALSLLN